MNANTLYRQQDVCQDVNNDDDDDDEDHHHGNCNTLQQTSTSNTKKIMFGQHYSVGIAKDTEDGKIIQEMEQDG